MTNGISWQQQQVVAQSKVAEDAGPGNVFHQTPGGSQPETTARAAGEITARMGGAAARALMSSVDGFGPAQSAGGFSSAPHGGTVRENDMKGAVTEVNIAVPSEAGAVQAHPLVSPRGGFGYQTARPALPAHATPGQLHAPIGAGHGSPSATTSRGTHGPAGLAGRVGVGPGGHGPASGGATTHRPGLSATNGGHAVRPTPRASGNPATRQSFQAHAARQAAMPSSAGSARASFLSQQLHPTAVTSSAAPHVAGAHVAGAPAAASSAVPHLPGATVPGTVGSTHLPGAPGAIPAQGTLGSHFPAPSAYGHAQGAAYPVQPGYSNRLAYNPAFRPTPVNRFVAPQRFAGPGSVPTLNAASSMTRTAYVTPAAGNGAGFSRDTNAAHNLDVQGTRALDSTTGHSIVNGARSLASSPNSARAMDGLRATLENAGIHLGPNVVFRVNGRIVGGTGTAAGARDGSAGTILRAGSMHQVDIGNSASSRLGQDPFEHNDYAQTISRPARYAARYI